MITIYIMFAYIIEEHYITHHLLHKIGVISTTSQYKSNYVPKKFNYFGNNWSPDFIRF